MPPSPTSTPRFPNGTGNSPFVWNPTPDPIALVTGTVRAGTWVLVQLSYRKTNTFPVETTVGVGAAATGFFAAHVIVSPHTDDGIAQKEGDRLQPTMYGGSATKQRTEYHVDPGWTFQVPWDSQLQIVSGGVSDPSVLVDVIVKLGMTPEALIDGPAFQEALLQGAHISLDTHSQRIYAPPVVGHPELVPATYFDKNGIDTVGLPTIPFPAGASALQVTDDVAISPAPTKMTFFAMGNLLRFGLQPGQIEQLGAITQGGGSTDGTPALWGTGPNTKIFKAVVWSRFGC